MSLTGQSIGASRNRTLTVTAESLCMVAPNGWEIMYAHLNPPAHAVEAAIRHARNTGATIIDERVKP